MSGIRNEIDCDLTLLEYAKSFSREDIRRAVLEVYCKKAPSMADTPMPMGEIRSILSLLMLPRKAA